MVVIDQWFKSAILDNTLVADLLLCLKHSKPKSPPLFSHWGAKKPRSSVSRSKHHRCSTAFSPTTPLSWTGSADCYEESTRSKTFSELVQEESSLIKERIYLKNDIENKKATFVAQRAGNESLKRRKLDLGSIYSDKPNSSADEHLSTLPRVVHSTSKAFANAAHEVDTHPRATRIVIPDLNMMPPCEEEEEEDSYANFPYGMS